MLREDYNPTSRNNSTSLGPIIAEGEKIPTQHDMVYMKSDASTCNHFFGCQNSFTTLV